jgi:protein-S-isoprenylcysteine O-methyltransferase Ste14
LQHARAVDISKGRRGWLMDKIRLALLVCGIAAIAVLVFWRSFIFWKKNGFLPIFLTSEDSLRSFALSGFKVVIFLATIVVTIYSFWPEYYQYLAPIPYLEDIRLKLAGLALLVISIIWSAIGQSHMHKSFRIGIDESAKTELVTAGLFKYSRNPIYLGVMVSITGLFLAAPNALSFALLCITYVYISVQMRIEEQWLQKVHGAAFEAYCKRVRRWI